MHSKQQAFNIGVGACKCAISYLHQYKKKIYALHEYMATQHESIYDRIKYLGTYRYSSFLHRAIHSIPK